MKQGWSGLEHMVYGEKGGGEDLLAVISYLFGVMEKAEPRHLRDAQKKARRPQGKLQVDVSQMFLLGVAWHWSRGPEGCEIASLQILIMRQDEALSTPTRSCSPALSRGWTRDHQMSVPASAALWNSSLEPSLLVYSKSALTQAIHDWQKQQVKAHRVCSLLFFFSPHFTWTEPTLHSFPYYLAAVCEGSIRRLPCK